MNNETMLCSFYIAWNEKDPDAIATLEKSMNGWRLMDEGQLPKP